MPHFKKKDKEIIRRSEEETKKRKEEEKKMYVEEEMRRRKEEEKKQSAQIKLQNEKMYEAAEETIRKCEEQRKKEEQESKRRKKEEEDTKRQKELNDLELMKAKKLKELINKFYEIAERKVSVLDEYGDENWDVLPYEIIICIQKIDKLSIDIDDRRKLIENKESNSDCTLWLNSNEQEKLQEISARDILRRKIIWAEILKSAKQEGVSFETKTSKLFQEHILLYNELEKMFRKYHSQRTNTLTENIDSMSGEEFETYVMKKLKDIGYEDIRGTKKTGDQGADLIIKQNGKTIVVQIKRFSGTVGNGAIQEVLGAVHIYSANEGWVITNSTFSSSAIELAQKSNVKLIDGYALANLKSIL